VSADPDTPTPPLRSARGARSLLGTTAALCAAWLVAFALPAPTSAGSLTLTGEASRHFACSSPISAKVPCRFSTPSGNIRCVWTPSPNNVACELLATHRAYRLRPTGKAKSIHIALHSRGETLPLDQILVFPESLSCHDTKTTMTCNQDFGLGFFKLARKGSRSA
jgi:hypothetical protein